MKALKGILVYTALVLVSIVFIFALGVGFLYLSKNSTLFGYYFRNVSFEDKVHYKNAIPSDMERISIKVNTKNYGVVLLPIDSDANLEITTSSAYMGFLKATVDPETQKKSAVVTPDHTIKAYSSVDSEGHKVYNIEITLIEQEGWLSYKKLNTMYIRLPFFHSASYDLNITTGDKDIEFRAGEREIKNALTDAITKEVLPINVNSLKIKTNKGSAIIGNFGSSIDIIEKNRSFENLDITTNGGTFDFTQFDSVTVTKGKLSLNSQNASYKFKKLEAQKGMEVIGKNVKFDANEVVCGESGFLYKSTTGTLKIGTLNSTSRVKNTYEDGSYKYTQSGTTKVYENTIFTESAVVEIDEVLGKLGLGNKYGSVNIKHLTHQASITSENGDVTIGESGYYPMKGFTAEDREYSETSSLIVYTTYGDIKVGEYYQDGIFYSKKGSITVNAITRYDASNLPLIKGVRGSEGARYFYSEITSKDGKITATTNGNPIRIVCTGDANVKLTVKKLFDSIDYASTESAGLLPTSFAENIPYYVSTKNGKIEAKLPIQSYLVLIEGKTSGEIGSVNSFSAEGTQIGVAKPNQPRVKITGKKIALTSNI